MSPLFTVPESELQPLRTLLPSGHYDADFAGAETMASKKEGSSWEGIKASFEGLATAEGATQVQGTTENGQMSVTINLAERGHSTLFSTAGVSDKGLQMSQRQLVELAVALGVEGRDESGNVFIAGETPEEVVETLNGARGTRVRFSVKVAPKKKGGQVVQDAEGNAILADNINRIWRPEGA